MVMIRGLREAAGRLREVAPDDLPDAMRALAWWAAERGAGRDDWEVVRSAARPGAEREMMGRIIRARVEREPLDHLIRARV